MLVKAIEDAALGVASVYRSLELPLPKQLPYASKDLRREWADLLARFMPFDLVIDEHTADGQEARVSKTSVAGSWGAVAGNLRFFADRFGVPRADHVYDKTKTRIIITKCSFIQLKFLLVFFFFFFYKIIKMRIEFKIKKKFFIDFIIIIFHFHFYHYHFYHYHHLKNLYYSIK